MKVTDIYESTLFNTDDDFDTEETKEEYYFGEFWNASDHLKFPGLDETVSFVIDRENNEVLVHPFDIDLIETDVDYETILERFASENFKDYFIELQTGNHYKPSDDPNYDSTKPYIEYRGGKGYYYYHHQYKY